MFWEGNDFTEKLSISEQIDKNFVLEFFPLRQYKKIKTKKSYKAENMD